MRMGQAAVPEDAFLDGSETPNGAERKSHVRKTVVVTVGLPARGKTFIARRLSRYFNWIGIRTRVFNVGNYRRKMFPEHADASFFDIDNVDGRTRRLKCAIRALNDLCTWLLSKGDVAVFDATNSTRERRDMIVHKCWAKHGLDILFVESICDDDKVVNKNVQSVKLCSPDYENMSSEEATADFLARIEKYKNQYQPIDELLEKTISFIKIIDVGRSFVVNRIAGQVQCRAVYFLMNIHVMPRSIYLSRSAETIGDSLYQIGGDESLSERGAQYSARLSNYILSLNIPDLVIWTSELNSAIETVSGLKGVYHEKWRALNELDPGLCRSLTYEEMARKYAAELACRDMDKFYFRYPMGESYEDLVFRLEPVVMELERAENIFVVTHLAVARCILGYFLNFKTAEIPYIKVPLHCVMKLTPSAYGCEVETIDFGISAADTHRGRPKNCSPSRTVAEALELTPGFSVDDRDTTTARQTAEAADAHLTDKKEEP